MSDLGGLQLELEALLGMSIDVLTPGDMIESAEALAHARPV